MHTRPLGPDGQPRRCRPRRERDCPHGVRLSAAASTARTTRGSASRSARTALTTTARWCGTTGSGSCGGGPTIYLPRILAGRRDDTEAAARAGPRRLRKVAEYQRRGLVHLHVLVAAGSRDARLPRRPAPPTRPALHNRAARARRCAKSPRSARPVPDELGGGRVGWGGQLDVRHSSAASGAARSPATWRSTRPRAPNRPAACCTASPRATSTPPRSASTSAPTSARRSRSTERRHARPTPGQRRSVWPPRRAAGTRRARPTRLRRAMSTDERVAVRLRDQGGEQVGRIRSSAAAARHRAGSRSTAGQTIALADVAVDRHRDAHPDRPRRDGATRLARVRARLRLPRALPDQEPPLLHHLQSAAPSARGPRPRTTRPLR